jgi:cytochrome c553
MRIHRSTYSYPLLAVLLTAWWLPATAAGEDFDRYNAEDINVVCATCHGEYGEGGKDGEYPRLAGQPASFIASQLHMFRDRTRPNIRMVEYIDERQMPDEDIKDISAYLSQIKLPSRLPPLKKGKKFDPLERLLQAKKTLNIPRYPGDVKAGEKTYKFECRSCHGDEGRGRADKGVPMLSGQYTKYLKRQVKKLINKVRIHDRDAPKEELLADFTEEELNNIWAYLSVVDDKAPDE